MKYLIRFLPLLFAIQMVAADRITMTITVTNIPQTSNTITVNASVRTWTNAYSSSTILTNLTGTNGSATNLFNAIALYPFTGPLAPSMTSSNVVRLVAPLGVALSGSIGGNWATLVLSTQSGPQTYTALWPIEHMVGETNRTNEASSLIQGFSTFSTQALSSASTALSNAVNLFNPQTINGGKTWMGTNWFTNSLWHAGLVSNVQFHARGGYASNLVLHTPKTTNLVNYGNPISSPGSGALSENFGASSSATAINSMALGSSSIAGGVEATAVGHGASAYITQGTAVGNSATTSNSAVAIGWTANAYGDNSIAIGANAQAIHNDSIIIGRSITTTSTNQVMIGASTHTVVIPGMLTVTGTQTNTTFRGTNVINGRVDFTSRANTALANGNNSGIVLGTNVYIRLSGPSAAYTNAGFAAEVDGSYHILQFDNPVSNMTILNQSGLDATAANRIVTGTGADVNLTNNPVMLPVIYDATAARWRIVSQLR